MPFPWTLQRYIFREMGKTFLLAAIALTGVVGLGGGVLNMIKLGEITPGQLIRLMALLLPLAVALTLPIAVLFGAAATYGRLSADNEFVACRSSGINMHVLFLPTVVLSLLSASVSFAFTNFLIPGMVRNLNEFVGGDVGALVRQRLSRPQGITLGGRYRIYADECVVDPSNVDRIILCGVAFVEVDGEEWVRYGTARELEVVIDRRETGFRISGSMVGLSFYDRKDGRFFQAERQVFPPNELPSLVPQKVKFLNLGELFHYLSEPTEWHEVREELRRLRQAAGRLMVYDALWQDWLDDKTLTLSDGNVRYTIQSRLGVRLQREGGIELTDMAIEERKADRQRWITAERAIFEVTRGGTITESGVEIELYNARLSDGVTSVERPKETLDPVAIAPDLIARVEALTEEELLGMPGAGADDPLADQRARVQEVRGETVRRIVGVVHERVAFSISVLVLVILGAALGIIFRGAHVMTAFGISFVPTLFVIITIVMGKQMSHNAVTYGLGLLVMWSGIVVVAGLDVWTLTRVLRR
ncbi:MAG: LptF/LptG family permease [Phycisphaerae bacterium]